MEIPSYDDLWEKAEEKRLEERDDEKQRLKMLALNLEHVPGSAKRELVKLIDGGEVSEYFIKGVKQYKKEIEAHWPKELKKLALKLIE